MAKDRGRLSDLKRRNDKEPSPVPESSTMRIAVAGTGGLARLIAHYIDEDTSYHVMFLSRNDHPDLTAQGYQVAVVDYSKEQTLCYALRGIDTVISTVTGQSQINLIQAAIAVRVRRFAPAEFEGPPQSHTANDLFDRRRGDARQLLDYHAGRIESTAFVCGILYERFQPGGLGASRIGMASGLAGEGDYIINCRTMDAVVPAYCLNNNTQSEVRICITAAQDVARFVTRALHLRNWPKELRMYGHRIKVTDFVRAIQELRGQEFNTLRFHTPDTLIGELSLATYHGDVQQQIRLRALWATTQGHYDFADRNLNGYFPDITAIDFNTWFRAKWNLYP